MCLVHVKHYGWICSALLCTLALHIEGPLRVQNFLDAIVEEAQTVQGKPALYGINESGQDVMVRLKNTRRRCMRLGELLRGHEQLATKAAGDLGICATDMSLQSHGWLTMLALGRLLVAVT